MTVRRNGLAILIAAGAATACTGASPQQTLQAYREALRSADLDRVAAHHSGRQPTLSDPRSLRAFKEAHPALWTAAQAQIQSPVAAVRVTAEVTLASGATVTLVQREGQWRVDGGTLWVPDAETPEYALLTLFEGVAAGELAAVRSVLPEARGPAFATDLALEAHLDQIRDRVAAARARIGPLRPGMAVVRGNRATLEYRGARRVRFRWEAKRWRVLDVE